MAALYVARGLDPAFADKVAEQLMTHDALGAHARDELGISPATSAHPVVTGLASAAAFSVGAALPLLVVVGAPAALVMWAVALSSLVFLGFLGAVAAHAGGASMLIAAMRITFWGALAMALTTAVGTYFGTII